MPSGSTPFPAPVPARAARPARPPRRTLAGPATVSGITLFSGVQASITIRPVEPAPSRGVATAPGVVFRRVDLPGTPTIPATAAHVSPEARRTVLSADPANPRAAAVHTVEHLLSALAGLGVTDAVVDVTGPEVPLGDGSALAFVEAVAAAGVVAFPAAAVAAAPQGAEPVAIVDPIRLTFGQATIEAFPPTDPGANGGGLELVYQLDYTGTAATPAAIPTQSASLTIPADGLDPDGIYARDVAPARTFCLLEEAQAMRQLGLFNHLDPKDMLVIGEAGPIDNSYRFPNEPARHKLLDLLGDLTLAGRPIHARIVAHRTGHAANHALARALAALP